MKIKFPTRKRALNLLSDWKGTTGCFELIINEGELVVIDPMTSIIYISTYTK